MKTSCKVLNLKVRRVSQKKASILNHWNESFLKRIPSVSCWRQHETLAYCRPLVARADLGKLDFHVGLNETANSFFATRCRFWSVNISVSPVTLYTKQHCAHKRCFIRHYRRDEMKMRPIDQSPQISVTQRRGLEKWIVEQIVWESLRK